MRLDLTHFVYRYELEWKDRVYVEADFTSKGSEMQIDCDFVNHTDQPESLSLNVVMSLQRPSKEKEELVALQAKTEEDTQWIDALDYVQIDNDQLVAGDGLLLGECRESGFVGGSFLGGRWFGKVGDRAEYRFEPREVEKIGLRYRGSGRFLFCVKGEVYDLELKQADVPELVYIPIDKDMIDGFAVQTCGDAVDFDGFVLGEKIRFDDGSAMLEPVIQRSDAEVILTFGDLNYQIEYEASECVWRRLHADDVGVLLSQKIHDHVNVEIGKAGHTYVDLFIRPVFVEPKSSQRIRIRLKAVDDVLGAAKQEEVQPLYKVQGNPEGRSFEL